MSYGKGDSTIRCVVTKTGSLSGTSFLPDVTRVRVPKGSEWYKGGRTSPTEVPCLLTGKLLSQWYGRSTVGERPDPVPRRVPRNLDVV